MCPASVLRLTPRIHQALAERDLLPATHLVDTGFLDAELLVDSEHDDDVDLLGPTRRNPRWQTREAAGFGVEDFIIDWEHERVIRPEGHRSSEW